MQKQLTFAENALDPSTWISIETDDVLASLQEHFGTWPETARLYHNYVSKEFDITPANDGDIEAIKELEGSFIAIVYPQGPVALIIIAVVILVAAVASMFMAKKPAAIGQNQTNQSANNDLSDRSNKARPNERIPDIFGTVNSTPDLIGATYNTYVNNQEVEHSIMCIGRGEYDMLADDVYDDVTQISEIDGASVRVYAPFTSPNSGDAPQLVIGSATPDPILTIVQSNSVNGQTLTAPNARTFTAHGDLYAAAGGIIAMTDFNTTDNFQDLFNAGDVVAFSIANFSYNYFDGTGAPQTEVNVQLSGNYDVDSVLNHQINLKPNYATISPAWALMTSRGGVANNAAGVSVAATNEPWIGPFLIELNGVNQIISSLVAENGLYENDGTKYSPFNVAIRFGIQNVDTGINPVGPENIVDITVQGSSTVRTTRAQTLNILVEAPASGRVLIRAKRITNTDLAFAGTVVDEVKWKNLYGAKKITKNDFGNVTIVQATTIATENALSLSQRKLNMSVTRKIQVIQPDGTVQYNGSNDAASIIYTMAIDPYIGNRPASEVDTLELYNTLAQVRSYFGTEWAAQFCYTFDDKTMSFEESIAAVAQTVFCNAYRRGKLIKLFFEKQTQDSSILFNHRNKVPASETRTVRFGPADDYDGIEYTYVDPGDDATITVYVPPDRSATNAKQIAGTGCRNNVQAYFQAWRAYNKMVYQNTSVEFTALEEANLLVLNERILVADNTRPNTQDGEVIDQDVLQLQLSQKCVLDPTKFYTIFLQYPDGSVESIPITVGSDAYHVVLSTAPEFALSTDADNRAKTAYIIVANDDVQQRAFLVSSIDPQDFYTSKLTAINYSDKYYSKDGDFINGTIQYEEFVDNDESDDGS